VRYAFRLVSPQKTLVFYANSQKSKEGWIAAISRGIERAKAKRQEIISTASRLANEGRQGMTQPMMSRLQTTAAFIGRSAKELGSGNVAVRRQCCYSLLLFCCVLICSNMCVLQVEPHEGHCIMCMQLFRMFNRKNQCPRCLHDVCGDCMSHKIYVPPRKVAVCDGCYGLSQEYQQHVASKYKVPT
jgi:hypothetical protein